MLPSHRLLVEMSEVRQEINSFPEDGERAKLDELTEKHMGLETRYRAAIVTESDEQAVEAAGGGVTPERAEIRRLVDRANLADFLAEAEGGNSVSGASLELRKAVLGRWPRRKPGLDAVGNAGSAGRCRHERSFRKPV